MNAQSILLVSGMGPGTNPMNGLQACIFVSLVVTAKVEINSRTLDFFF